MTARPNQPLVSVIMPTYNQREYIGAAIRSVLNQTYDAWELIVIDNFSDDGTAEVVAAFDDPRISRIPFANHGVIAASRNAGIERARGELIAFLDSDDGWAPGKLLRQVRAFSDRPDAGLISCEMLVHRDRPGAAPFEMPPPPPSDGAPREGSFEGLLFGESVYCSSVMVSREALDKAGRFDENPELISCEDWDLWTRIARDFTILRIPHPCGFYRVHETNVSFAPNKLDKITAALRKPRANGWITRRQFRRARSRYACSLAWRAWRAGDSRGARSLLVEALQGRRCPLFAAGALAAWMLTFLPGSGNILGALSPGRRR
jgi:glycosyltransferase involved in cell wall biosynthesis